MFFWNRKKSLNETGIFKGFRDYHSHILYGVDDGVKTLEEALDILSLYESLGFSEVWLTPHIMEDIPNETARLKSRFEELKNAYREKLRGDLELHLAAEYMLDIYPPVGILHTHVPQAGPQRHPDLCHGSPDHRRDHGIRTG
jgi:hypothetical protein